MNIIRFSKRSGLVKLKEHQMQDKITEFFPTSGQIFAPERSENRKISLKT